MSWMRACITTRAIPKMHSQTVWHSPIVLVSLIVPHVAQVGATIAGSDLAVGEPVNATALANDQIGDTVLFVFGEVSNAFNNVATASDRITVSVVAQVANVPSNQEAATLSAAASATADVHLIFV